MNLGFWEELSRPIIGLSPMDGVTDAPTRKMVATTSKPSVIITEFVNVEGLARGAIKMLDDFVYSEAERPVVAQIYGIETDSFYQVALMACFLGFDGIDINMGCPAKKVSARGAGAGLIKTPLHASSVIESVQKAVTDFSHGITLHEAGVRPKVIQEIERRLKGKSFEKRMLPVSVKTRMGYDEVVADKWIEHLLSHNIAAITLHGRTLKQGYSGDADWDVIGKAAQIVKKSGLKTLFLGNGDIQSLEDAKNKIQKYNTDGVLVGRSTYGNPWFFSGKDPSEAERKEKAIEHSRVFEDIFPERKFFIMRKHFGWYMKNFDGAKELRNQLMREANSTKDVMDIVSGYKNYAESP